MTTENYWAAVWPETQHEFEALTLNAKGVPVLFSTRKEARAWVKGAFMRLPKGMKGPQVKRAGVATV